MNRYNKGPTIGGPSKATASTLCQKCLKRGHYSFECKAVAQERPYVSRPSRTQQLLNPKLVPKLTSDIPQDLLRKKGVADEQLAKVEQERGRKRERQSEEPEARGPSKRMRSASSISVSTISTDLSRSPSPRRTIKNLEIHRNGHARSASLSQSPDSAQKLKKEPGHRKRPTSSISQSISPNRVPLYDSEKKRRRASSRSSVGSYTSDHRSGNRDSNERTSSRNTRRKFVDLSPPSRGRDPGSRSPYRGRRRLSNDRHSINFSNPSGSSRRSTHGKERSLSPFSKRLALTQAMNVGR